MDYLKITTWEEVPLAVRAGLVAPFCKRGGDGVPGISHLADVLGYRAGPINAHFGGPRPVTNLLIGAALGSLGGYGVGRMGEQLLPGKYFEPGAARKRMAILGAALGSAFPAYQAFDSVRHTGQLSSVLDKWPPPAEPMMAEAAVDKSASVSIFDPVISRDEFGQLVMADPNTPMALRAATAGMIEAASAVRGSDVVSPWDVGKIAVGAGSGLVSGLIAGKALGLLAGLNRTGQEKLQEIGLWSGVLRAVVPQALGLR